MFQIAMLLCNVSLIFIYFVHNIPRCCTQKEELTSLFGHETVSEPGGTTLERLSKKFTISILQVLGLFLYFSFRMYNAPTFRAAQQCH